MDEELRDLANSRAAITKAAEERSPGLSTLIQAHYKSLIELAQRIYSREAKGNSVSPATLVHEAYVRLIDQPNVTARGSVFFRACFAQECRRVLVDHARRRNAERRGGGRQHESLAGQAALGMTEPIDILVINEAIEDLQKLKPRLAQIVDMRVFGAMTIDECAEALTMGPRTVDKEWAFARSWLQQQLR